jgi:hypothetical protein
MNAWSQPPKQLLPEQKRSLMDGDGTLLLVVVGAIALLLVAYLVIDYFQVRRRALRYEALRRPRRG